MGEKAILLTLEREVFMKPKRRSPIYSLNRKPDEGLSTEIALERFALIAPLRHPGLDRKHRRALCRQIAQKGWSHPLHGHKSLCERTVWNWYQAYEGSQLEGVRPKGRKDRGTLKAFDKDILDKAVALKEELPSRKVERCIEILSLRGDIKAGSVKRSTLQRHLQKLGMTGKKIKNRDEAVRRYCAEKPGDVWHSDEKHGPYIYLDGRYVKTKIFGIIDDCSRNCCGMEAFLDGSEPNLESMFKDGLLIWGCPSVFYCDNGKVYVSRQFTRICAELGISLLHTPIYSPESNGKQERFWGTLAGFIQEANNARYTSIAALNQALRAYVDLKYNRVVHSAHGRSPHSVYMEGLASTRTVPPESIETAFRHVALRKVAKDATFRFDGRVFEVDAALAGQQIELRYDPGNTSDIVVYLGNERVQRAKPFRPPAHLPRNKKDTGKPAVKAAVKSSRQFLNSLVEEKQRQKQKIMVPRESRERFSLANLLELLDLPEQRLTRQDRQNIQSVFDTFGPFDPDKSTRAIKKAAETKGKARHLSFYLRTLVESNLPSN